MEFSERESRQRVIWGHYFSLTFEYLSNRGANVWLLTKCSFILVSSDDSPPYVPKLEDEKSFHEIMHRHEIHQRRSAAIPQSSLCLVRLVASRNISLCKTVQSNDLEEVVCWYYEKKPSNTKVVRKASVYGSEEINSSANFNSK